MLAGASAALGRGDAAGAIAVLERDAAVHPDGALAEEREALRIEALIAVGRRAEASEAARAFAARYPNSIHKHVVEKATQENAP